MKKAITLGFLTYLSSGFSSYQSNSFNSNSKGKSSFSNIDFGQDYNLGEVASLGNLGGSSSSVLKNIGSYSPRKDDDYRVNDDYNKKSYPNIYGNEGPKGDKGDRGYPGKDGLDGKPGAKGEPGKPGRSNDGKPGPKGDKGKQGQPGRDGKNGVNGEPGKPGNEGPVGEPGKSGRDGKQGAPGDKGEQGYPGRDGQQGPPGPPGKSKKQGRPGPPGPPGPPGNCDCSKRRSNNKKPRDVQPVNIDTGIGNGDIFYGGYGDYKDLYSNGYNSIGQGKGLSGNAGYDDYYYGVPNNDAALPERYTDDYRPQDNANYKISLPDGASIAKIASVGNLGLGGISGGNKKISSNSVGRKSIGGSSNIGNIKKGSSGIYNDKDVEDKKFIKADENEKKADIYIDADQRVKNYGYDDEIAYNGAEVYEDAAAAEQKYVKGEAFLQDGQEAYRKESLYGGDALYQTDDVETNAKVAYEVDHSLRFKNDFNDENHRGSYKGDEFNVYYKASDVQGGYKNNELDRSKKAAAYQGSNAEGDFLKAGKYYGDDYKKYADDENDLYYRDHGHGSPQGYDPKFGGNDDYGYNNRDEPDLYSKFKGEKGPDYGDDYGNYGKGYGLDGQRSSPYYPYGERYRAIEDAEKDDLYRGYGANFEGQDIFSDKKEAEAYAGAEEKVNEKIAFDKGNYREVDAEGKNKFASYAGDYQTNKKSQDVDFNVKHFEDLYQDLEQDVKSDQYYAKYEGEDVKKAVDSEKKFGQYTDAEINRKQDAIINGKRYNGNEFNNLRDKDIEAELYTKQSKDKIKGQEIYAKPRGYRGEYYDDKENDYRPDSREELRNRISRGEYGYIPKKDNYYRRRLLNNELNQLKIQLSSLKLTNLLSKNDLIYSIIGLILAAILGSLSFIGIMYLCGYKTKKVSKETNSQLLNESDSELEIEN